MSAILESAPADRVLAFVELPDESYAAPVPAGVELVFRGADRPGDHVLRAVAAAPVEDVDHAWVCGESGLATSVRRHLVGERGVDRRRIAFSGYWKVGQART